MVSHNLAWASAWFVRAAADNTKDFWAREKQAYADEVRAPFLALLAEVDTDVTSWRVYRPHNDTRFAKDRGPLKTFLGALRIEPDGTGRYLQVDARGLLTSRGMPYLAPDQLPRWREAIADDRGEEFARAVNAAVSLGGTLKSGYPEPLMRAPRGVDPQHPRIEWLRWKGVEVFGRRSDPDDSPVPWILDTWAAGDAVCGWLAGHVGPSALERPRR